MSQDSAARGPSITLGNIIEAIRAIALRNRYVARRGFRGASLEMKTPVHYGKAMSVMAERVVAPLDRPDFVPFAEAVDANREIAHQTTSAKVSSVCRK